jgi:hypothetical protein
LQENGPPYEQKFTRLAEISTSTAEKSASTAHFSAKRFEKFTQPTRFRSPSKPLHTTKVATFQAILHLFCNFASVRKQHMQ